MRVFCFRHSFFVLQFTFSIAANLHCGDQFATLWNVKCNYPKCRSRDLRSHSIGCRCVATNGGRGSICDWPSSHGHGWNENNWNAGMDWWLPITIGVEYVCPRNYLTAISIQAPTLSGEWNVQAILRGGWGKFLRCLSILPNKLHSANDFWQVPYHNKPELNRIFPESVAWTRCGQPPVISWGSTLPRFMTARPCTFAPLFWVFSIRPTSMTHFCRIHLWYIDVEWMVIIVKGFTRLNEGVGYQCLGKLDELWSDLFVETGSVSVHGCSPCRAYLVSQPSLWVWSTSAGHGSMFWNVLRMPLDLQSLKVFDCLRESIIFSQALRYQSVLKYYQSPILRVLEGSKRVLASLCMPARGVHCFWRFLIACCHWKFCAPLIQRRIGVLQSCIFVSCFLTHQHPVNTQYHMQLASKVAVASWQDVGGEYRARTTLSFLLWLVLVVGAVGIMIMFFGCGGCSHCSQWRCQSIVFVLFFGMISGPVCPEIAADFGDRDLCCNSGQTCSK